ncbi:hypothetical protein SDC9_101961 [bioreactor metagenome]|uniref:Uncharacterized protein n=1 Tax=bioreactor metagenome TaxID=1076179 RepID=A0A645AQW4_9ZZZZ
MRDDDDRNVELLVDIHQQFEYRDRRLRVEGGGRLVAEQYLGIQRQRPRDADALFLSAAQVAHLLVPFPREADQFEQFVHP